jgi:hypothetical protein
MASAEGRQIECVLNCQDEGSPVFKLSNNGLDLNDQYDHDKLVSDGEGYYDPPDLYVVTVLGKVYNANPDPLRDAILGFPVAWSGASPQSWRVYLAGEVEMTDDNQIATVGLASHGIVVKRMRYMSHVNPLGRRMLRVLTGGPGYITWGSDKAVDRQFCMLGRVFTYWNKSGKVFIGKEILSGQ